MRYRLRTLLIVLILGPPVIWGLYQAPAWHRSTVEWLHKRDKWVVKPRYVHERGYIGGPPRQPPARPWPHVPFHDP